MHEAGQHRLGEHDFTSFRGAGCQSRSRHRCVHNLQVRRFADLVALDITANAFLLHMVRNIAGALLQVGRQEQPVAWVPELLRARDRRLLGPTAPPAGLYLASVYYPQKSFPPAPMPGPLRGLQPTAL